MKRKLLIPEPPELDVLKGENAQTALWTTEVGPAALSPPLLRLPPELRLMIYAMLHEHGLGFPRLLCIDGRRGFFRAVHSRGSTDVFRQDEDRGVGDCFCLMLTCRRIYSELLPMLYNQVRVILGLHKPAMNRCHELVIEPPKLVPNLGARLNFDCVHQVSLTMLLCPGFSNELWENMEILRFGRALHDLQIDLRFTEEGSDDEALEPETKHALAIWPNWQFAGLISLNLVHDFYGPITRTLYCDFWNALMSVEEYRCWETKRECLAPYSDEDSPPTDADMS